MRIVRNPDPMNHGVALLGAFCAGVVVGVALCAGSCAHAAHAPAVGCGAGPRSGWSGTTPDVRDTRRKQWPRKRSPR